MGQVAVAAVDSSGRLLTLRECLEKTAHLPATDPRKLAVYQAIKLQIGRAHV